MTGIKHDKEKARVALVLGGFANALLDVSKVGTFGAKKYAPDNWKTLPEGKERCMDAAMRHIFQYLSGEELDEEMQLPHLAAATWELLAVQEFIKKEGNKNLFTK
jgi:urate oxidase